MLPPIEMDLTSVVVRGIFNPAIVAPGWLTAQELVSPKEDVQVEVISPEVSVLKTDWFRLQVTRDGLQVETERVEERERARDIVLGILQTLPHTPLVAIGINRAAHAQLPSAEKYHAAGDAIMPKAFWESFLTAPGLRSSTIWSVRPDTYVGRLSETVEPSQAVKFGLYIAHNDHYVLQKYDEPVSGRDDPRFFAEVALEPKPENFPLAIEILRDDWTNAMARADVLVARVLELTE
ncbi:hypothetical protein ACXR2U_16355 [Jatrophihabitans sp. YIM 134969]